MKGNNFMVKKCLVVLGVGVIFFVFLMQRLPTEETKGIGKFGFKTPSYKKGIDIDYVQANLLTLDQKDEQLVQYVRIKHLTPPSNLPYNLDNNLVSPDGFSKWVANFFKNESKKTFIEAGANAGERASHTLFLEKELGWSGLLIECNPTVVPFLKSRHRRAWVADVCLAPSSTPGVSNFSNPTNWTQSGTLKKPWSLGGIPTKWNFFDVQTIPLFTVLAALGWKEVDYFSFDIEGVELSVLKHFPFDSFIFKVLIIEIYFYSAEEKIELDQLLTSNGYFLVEDIENDKIYIHNSVKHLLNQD